VTRPDRLISSVRAASIFVLALLIVEIILVASMGAVRARAIIGPSFYVIHLVLFFICTPALANVLVFRHRKSWYLVPVACTALAFFLVLFQYSVSESLYGIDGESGPYSNAPSSSQPSTASPSK